MDIKTNAVESSNIARIGYHEASETLRIEFINGSVWDYRDVPPEVYEKLMAAESKGKAFNKIVRGLYSGSQQ